MTVGQLRAQAANALRRARALPIGPCRNDLRQIAIGLLWLERKQLASDPEQFFIIHRDRNQGSITLGQLEER
ncbi:MAG: hypothetical protein ABW175_02310 [Bradyrhizobium sp.]